MQSQHPARQALIEHGRALPTAWAAWAQVCEAAECGPGDTPAGPAQLEMMRRLIAERGAAALEHLARDTAGDWLRLQTLVYRTLSIWRYTQGIYRFDPDVYAAVRDTPINGEVPANILMTLPEWVVYIETPGLTGYYGEIYGAWVHVPRFDGRRTSIQVNALQANGGVDLAIMPIGDGMSLIEQMTDAVERMGGTPEDVRVNRSYLEPILSLALYLCARPGDITGRRGAPANPAPVRTKRGPRMFPAAAESSWDVGVRMGSALRRATAAANPTQHGAVEGGHQLRGHVRRAHWHTILSGPRIRPDGSVIPAMHRKADLRWLPPIAVALDSPDELLAAVRPVR